MVTHNAKRVRYRAIPGFMAQNQTPQRPHEAQGLAATGGAGGAGGRTNRFYRRQQPPNHGHLCSCFQRSAQEGTCWCCDLMSSA